MKQRMSIFPKILAVALVTLLVWAGNLNAQTESQFVVQITNPSRDDIKVGKETIVGGTASIPSGNHLWVLAHRIDFKGFWWPQREADIDPKNHEWQVNVTFG